MDVLLGIRRAVWALMLAWIMVAVIGAWAGMAKAATPQSAPSAQSAQQASAPSDTAMDCLQLAALIDQQKSLISRETGQIKRELAALRDDLAQPGIREVFAGIGYIFGLAGIGFYFHARRSRGVAAKP